MYRCQCEVCIGLLSEWWHCSTVIVVEVVVAAIRAAYCHGYDRPSTTHSIFYSEGV